MAVGAETSSLSVEDSKQVQDVQEVQEVEGMVLCGLSAGAARGPLHYQGLQPRAVMLHYCLNWEITFQKFGSPITKHVECRVKVPGSTRDRVLLEAVIERKKLHPARDNLITLLPRLAFGKEMLYDEDEYAAYAPISAPSSGFGATPSPALCRLSYGLQCIPQQHSCSGVPCFSSPNLTFRPMCLLLERRSLGWAPQLHFGQEGASH